MDLQKSIVKFPIERLDLSALEGQEEAFFWCVDLFRGVEKTKTQNKKHTSYGYKHMVENPRAKCNPPKPPEIHLGYVYEGTFILAALSLGFERKVVGGGLTSTFNFSERSLHNQLREFATKRAESANDRQN